MIYAIQCWVRRVIFRRQFPQFSHRALEYRFEMVSRQVAELTRQCNAQQHDLKIAVAHGVWRHNHPLASHFHLNPALNRIMKSRFRFEKQVNDIVHKQVVGLQPAVLQLNQS